MVAGDQSDPADVLVIGAGPGGYVAALRAAQLGRKVTLVEADRVGGVCLNEGCIPSKQLGRFAAAKAAIERLAISGMPPLQGAPDMVAFHRRRKESVDTLVRGVQQLLKAAGVDTVHGEARFVGRTRVVVQVGEESVRFFDFKDVVIATGSEPIAARSAPFDGERIFEPSRALEWKHLPQSLLVMGDDYVALELAVAFSRLGSKVRMAVPGERLLPDFDADLSAVALRGARIARVDVQLNAAQFDDGTAERVVVSAGRRPRLAGLDLAAAGLHSAGDHLAVDAQLRLDRHAFAIGDVTPGLPLAHRAMMQGRVVGEVLGGLPSAADATAFPRVVFAEPEIASVGLTESEAVASGRALQIGRFPLLALGRAVIEPGTTGFAKLLFEAVGTGKAGNGPLIGAHLAGPRSTELIAEMALAIEMGATAEDLALTVHAHPTFAEALMEAAEVSLGRPIHIRPARPRSD